MNSTGRKSTLYSKVSRRIKRIKARKTLAVFFFLLFSLSIAPKQTQPVHAATLEEINAQINQVSKSLEAKRGEATSLKNQIDIIDGQLTQLQLQMEATQIEIDTTTARISEAEKELKKQQEILNEHLRVLYEEGNTSAIEKIVGSNSFSDFVNKNEYLQTMELDIKTTVDKIKQLKKELDEKKKSLDTMKKDQVLQKKSMDSQRLLKDSLLAKANADAAGLQGKLDDLYGQKAAMSVQYGEGVSGGSSGYPYGNPPPRNIIDTPDPWGYLIGECTSYAAWKRASMGKPIPRAIGNASAWVSIAGGGPSVGSVMVMPYVGGYGHVAIVEAVYGDGTVHISEYNWKPFSYTTRDVNPHNYSAVFIN